MQAGTSSFSIEVVSGGFPASIPKSGPEIKNRCTLEDVSGQNLAAIPKSGLEIKNHCTLEDVFTQIHVVIPKSGLEIKNHCTQENVFRQKPAVIPKFTPSNQESLESQGQNSDNPCSDSHIQPMKSGIAATTTAIGGTSLLCDNGN